jgi:hypothetical protein
VLRKLPAGMNVRLLRHDTEMTAGQAVDFQTSMKNQVQKQKQDYFTRLTPEQRVERARNAHVLKEEASVQP